MKSVCLLAACVLVISGCSEPNDTTHMSGKELFNALCADCHKVTGSGSFLEGIPANRNTLMSEGEVVAKIMGRNRSPDSQMPAFPELSQQQARNIAVYLKEEL